MKKKLAIITLYDNINFGNKLQNYAVQSYFEAMNFDVVTLPNWEQFHPTCHIKGYIHSLAHRIIRIFGLEKERVFLEQRKQQRRNYIESFSRQYLTLGPIVRYTKMDSKLKEEYDYFVTGSDQVWHGWSGRKKELEFFFLQFADPEQRITIAPSFGFEEFPKKYLTVYKNGLQGIQNISCREESGKKLIKSLSGKNATILLDPTMLIDVEKWMQMLRRPSQFINMDYIFVYALGGYGGTIKNNVEKLAKRKKYSVIDINNINSDYYILTRPDEFLYWIYSSKLVVTDSFHAVVFSILFHKPFIVFSREDELGMENRLDTLLDKFNLMDRKYTRLKNDFEKENDPILSVDFGKVDEVIQLERKKAKDFYSQCFDDTRRIKI